jgi:hypothetical protein
MEKEMAYTQDQLSEAFESVQPSTHWKDRINKVIPKDSDTALITEAVIHFTGSVPNFTPTKKGIRVRAAGYWETIGA